MKSSSKTSILVAYCALITIVFLVTLEKNDFIDGFIRKKIVRTMKSCGNYPKSEDVTVDNIYWQILEHSRGFVGIFNAYLDLRQNRSVVRINVNSKILNESHSFYCQFWHNEHQPPLVVKASEVLLIWGELELFKQQLLKMYKKN